MKALSKILLATYLCILLWLVLFKFSYDPIGVILHFQTRSLNLIPFALGNKSEIISNIIAFVPLGVMLGVNFKQSAFWQKLAAIFAFSVVVETVQFALAIGATDITDILMNTLGGDIGLIVYAAAGKLVSHKYLDRFVFVTSALVLLVILYLRIFVLRVRY